MVDWYRTELPISLRQLSQPLMIVFALGHHYRDRELHLGCSLCSCLY